MGGRMLEGKESRREEMTGGGLHLFVSFPFGRWL